MQFFNSTFRGIQHSRNSGRFQLPSPDSAVEIFRVYADRIYEKVLQNAYEDRALSRLSLDIRITLFHTLGPYLRVEAPHTGYDTWISNGCHVQGVGKGEGKVEAKFTRDTTLLLSTSYTFHYQMKSVTTCIIEHIPADSWSIYGPRIFMYISLKYFLNFRFIKRVPYAKLLQQGRSLLKF